MSIIIINIVLQIGTMAKMANAIYKTGGINYTYGTPPELLCELFRSLSSSIFWRFCTADHVSINLLIRKTEEYRPASNATHTVT